MGKSKDKISLFAIVKYRKVGVFLYFHVIVACLLLIIPIEANSLDSFHKKSDSASHSITTDSIFVGDSTQNASIADSINDRKIYRIGLPHVPGLMSRNPNGNISGFALEVFQSIAIDEKIQYVWVDGDWSELFNMLQEGKIDMLPGVQESDARKSLINFTYNNLYSIWSELYINKNTIFEDVSQLSGKKIALVINDNSSIGFLNYISSFNVEVIPVFFNNHSDALMKLSQGEVYGMAGSTPNILTDLPANIKNSGLYFNPTELKFAFPKNSDLQLRNKIDIRLGLYKSDNKSIYFQLFEKYNISEAAAPSSKMDWLMPEWLKILLLIFVVILFMAITFVFTLKKQVNLRTKELADRQAYLRKAMEVGQMGIWNFNLRTKKLFFSDEVYAVTGIKKISNIISLDDLKTFVHPDDREKLINLFHLIGSSNQQQNYCRIITPQKEIVHVRIFGQLQTNANNYPSSTVGLIQNVSPQIVHEKELVAAKEKAEESEKMKTSFLENMSHEIRTPLNSIIGFSDMLTNEKLSKEKREEFKTIIHKQNELLLTLINDILDFSRIESGSLEIDPSDLITHRLLDDVFDNFQPLSPPSIEFKKAEVTPELKNCSFYSDESRIRQILNNLVSNAFKYTRKGTIEFGCRLSKTEGHFDIYVKDTGIGIPVEQQSHIFDRFKQLDTMNQGAGLGLAISQSLARMLGTEIKLSSEFGKGSEFYLSFPITKQ